MQFTLKKRGLYHTRPVLFTSYWLALGVCGDRRLGGSLVSQLSGEGYQRTSLSQLDIFLAVGNGPNMVSPWEKIKTGKKW